MKPTAWAATALVLAALATACASGPPRRVSPPATSFQQVTVNADGSWAVALRLQNYSSVPMRFENVRLAVTLGDQDAGTLEAAPQFSIGPESADVYQATLQPTSAARMLVADALATRRSLAYTLEGSVQASPEDARSRSFEVKARSTLTPIPGLDGVLR